MSTHVDRGRLHRVHRGIYAVGHPLLSMEGRWMAAVLACGEGAVLSHRSAAALWELRPSDRSRVDVIAPGRAGRGRPGIDVHRAGGLRQTDVTTVRGIRCTTVARTLLDLAEVVDRRALERACEQAELLQIFDARALADVLSHATGRRGAPLLRALLLEDSEGPGLTRSELEERFLALCRHARVPVPRVNYWIPLDDGAVEVDFAWPEQRLIVETDGHRFHGTRQAFERDRRRDQRLMLAGWRVVRFTWRQVVREPERVAATIRTLLAEYGRSGEGGIRTHEAV